MSTTETTEEAVLPLGLTSGMILDPFSMMMAGLDRGKVKHDPFSFHGEEGFKRSFVNAMYFAETITVVGPIAQLVPRGVFYASPKSIYQLSEENAMLYPEATMGTANLYRLIESAFEKDLWMGRRKNSDGAWDMVDTKTGKFKLPLFPDMYLKAAKKNADDLDYEYSWLIQEDTRNSFPAGNEQVLLGGVTKDGRSLSYGRNMPMLGLMAVVMTFKKPWGVSSWATKELTNLSTWPSLCFFIPALVPSRPLYYAKGNTYGLRNKAVVSSWRIDPEVFQISAFGHPFQLMSVDKSGKTPDVMRAFSEEISRMWSTAAVYCAWNMETRWTKNGIEDTLVSVDPVGAGRRIRNFNRHCRTFRRGVASGFVEHADGDFENSGYTLLQSKGVNPFQYNVDAWAGPFSSRSMGCIFVLPSFLQASADSDARSWMPPALSILAHTHLNIDVARCFVHSSSSPHFVDTTYDRNITSPGSSFYREVSRTTPSAMEMFQEHYEETGNRDRAVSVLSTIPINVSYNPSGAPTFFKVQLPMNKHLSGISGASAFDVRGYAVEERMGALKELAKEATRGVGFKGASALSSANIGALSEMSSVPTKKSLENIETIIPAYLFDSEEMFA